MNTAHADDRYPIALFQAFGVEIEYMIVDADTLDVRPLADALFRAAAGSDTPDVEPDGPDGVISWSNELALHVAELKTQRPAPSLAGLAHHFQDHVRRINAYLAPMGARLLPTGMHPWMDPDRETRLWPHENNEIYAVYDRIFGCRGHGWGNLQSTHINLPFVDDAEFGRLHAACRLILPLIPALAASSPYADGKRAPNLDQRLKVYRHNADRVPSMVGHVVPERVFTREAFERDVLGRLYADLAPHDPEGVLRHEFANARGAMARFDRGAIELRLIDTQECPAADLAAVTLITEAVRALTEERWLSLDAQQAIEPEPLLAALMECVRDAEGAMVREPALLAAFGQRRPLPAGELWAMLLDELVPSDAESAPTLRRMLRAGSLASRLVRALGESPSRDAFRAVYAELGDRLHAGELFRAD